MICYCQTEYCLKTVPRGQPRTRAATLGIVQMEVTKSLNKGKLKELA